MPLLTNSADDFITLGCGVVGLAILAVFRHELFAMRAQSALLLPGVVAAGLMLGSDAYGHGVGKAFEFPSQVAAVGLLLLAHLSATCQGRAALPRHATRAAAHPRWPLAGRSRWQRWGSRRLRSDAASIQCAKPADGTAIACWLIGDGLPRERGRLRAVSRRLHAQSHRLLSDREC